MARNRNRHKLQFSNRGGKHWFFYHDNGWHESPDFEPADGQPCDFYESGRDGLYKYSHHHMLIRITGLVVEVLEYSRNAEYWELDY